MDDNFLDRTPPQNIEAEQAVIGAVFLEPNALITASEILMPDDFTDVPTSLSLNRCWI
ncbi:Replicative DNA helicase [Listeria grayi]|uniref:Replicative DNA helicase n=1 Tax=Listeria grayi TaxID=1641 RepID=A0A378MG38_LISGR|nr:Replicative DNA helicase [Listeria grayi]